MLLRGKSESGNERNCCFLNLGASSDPSRERFATVSAATGLDFPDDARGLALCDWDHDGQVDLWITNRTAPRVRLMLNRYQPGGNHWISLRLHGDGKAVNRDAVGARIEIYLPGAKTPLLRTVAAGSGFLSQSSVWQHAGLGKAGSIEKIVVRWPGGGTESFSGAQPDGFLDLTQGSGTAVSWKVPDAPGPLKVTAPPPLPEETEAARLVLLSPLPVPQSFLPAAPGKRGLLLNVWSADCLNCKGELREWGPHVKGWEKAGVTLASWCVDADRPAAEKLAKSLKFSNPVLVSAKEGSAGPSPDLLGVLNALQMSCFGLQKEMPVPVSFLFDAQRRLVAVYKGPVAAAQIKADFALLTATSTERRTAASPDKSGRWHDPLGATGIRGTISLLIDEGFKEAAEKLLEAAILHYNAPLPPDAPAADAGWSRKEFAEAQRLLALWNIERKDFATAEQRYLLSLQAVPLIATRRDLAKLYSGLKDPKLYPALAAQLEEITRADPDPVELGKLGVLKIEMGQPDGAIEPLRISLGKSPDAVNFFQLGQAHKQLGQGREAVTAWEKAIELNPEMLPAINNLAWLYATGRRAEWRDGAKALVLAGRAVALTEGKHPVVMATLAAAQAETGDFKAAEKTALKAKEMAGAAGDQPWTVKLGGWVEQFQKAEPVRD